jgi:hypothetical protein
MESPPRRRRSPQILWIRPAAADQPPTRLERAIESGPLIIPNCYRHTTRHPHKYATAQHVPDREVAAHTEDGGR